MERNLTKLVNEAVDLEAVSDRINETLIPSDALRRVRKQKNEMKRERDERKRKEHEERRKLRKEKREL